MKIGITMGLSLLALGLAACGGSGVASPESAAAAPSPQRVASRPAGETASAELFDHADYDAIVRKHVGEDGSVDYEALLAGRKPLDAYVARLGEVAREEFTAWPRNEQMAYYINAYNAVTLLRIINHYPPTGFGILAPKVSIKNIDGVWKGIENRIGGEEITLDVLEQKRLRPLYEDPRIHAAINCASTSCPKLWNRAYTAADLDEQLDEASRRYARDPIRNLIDPARKIVHVSKILDWYRDDFLKFEADVPKVADARGAKGKFAGGIGFLSRYVEPEIAEFLKSGDYDFEVLKYDWSLNGK